MIKDAFVYPSDRVSDRVPFGTGKAVGEIIENGTWLTYHENCYRDLGQLLNVISENIEESADLIFNRGSGELPSMVKRASFFGSMAKASIKRTRQPNVASAVPRMARCVSNFEVNTSSFRSSLSAGQTVWGLTIESKKHILSPTKMLESKPGFVIADVAAVSNNF